MAAQGSSCDFAESVALRYPLRVILSLMGLPREDEDMMLRLTQEVFNPQDPDMSKTRSDVDESEASSYDLGALAEFNQFFSDLIKARRANRSEEHTSELQSLMRISYAVFCLKKKKIHINKHKKILTLTTTEKLTKKILNYYYLNEISMTIDTRPYNVLCTTSNPNVSNANVH